MVVQVWEVLDANKTARRAFEQVLARPTMLEVAKNVICLLLWLETITRGSVLEDVSTMESIGMLTRVVMEAEAIYSFLLNGHDALPESIPTIEALCGRGRLVDLRFFQFHKELVSRGVAVIRDTIGALVFDDMLVMMRRFRADINSSVSPKPPVLAPKLMAPFVAVSRTPPVDSRTAFIAFTECPCQPLSPQEIVSYFEQRLGFGRCIERVEMEPTLEGKGSKHGVIVFMSREQRDEAMFGETATFFRTPNWHDMWVQSYMPPF